MSVFFLYPAFLIGLLAASLPILIHLLNRRKLQRIQFPAVRFILLSQKRISRSYQLRHWLLLALRTLAIVLLALLLANPIFQTGAGLFAGGGPVSLVVVLDNSLSMTWSGDGGGFKQAKEAARILIDSLNAGDRAAVIPTNISGKEAFRLKEEKEVLLRELQGIEIADGSANFTAALDAAYQLLNAPAGQKEIRLITDMGLTGWERDMDQMLEDFFGRRTRPWWPERWSRGGELDVRIPAVDVFEEKDDIVVKAELPGMEKENIEVNLADHSLTIKGEKKKEEEVKEENYYRSERSYGSFMRTVDLPKDVRADKIKAAFKNGILEVRMPKTEEAKAKEIKVKVE